jgi:hypothetical protein
VLGSRVIVGLDPATGELLWQREHPMSGDHVASTPVWDGRSRLFFSGAYGEGSHCLELTREAGAPDGAQRTTATELWHNARLRIHHSNVVRSDDYVYGTSGDFAALAFTALDLKTGQVLWQDRRIARANSLLADGRLILLDESGRLVLATASPGGLEIHAECQLFDGHAWTAPTLAGNSLYIRNRTDIMAFELPPPD